MLLANAQVLDTRPVKARLNAFTATHRRFIEAQAKVDEADDLERAEAKRVLQLDLDQDEAVETLAVCLINDRQPRRNPFGKFSDHTPSEIAGMAYADEAKAIHALVEAVQRDKSLSQKTRSAAAQAEAAAGKLEAALPGWELRRVFLAGVRQERDNLSVQWDVDYTALRHLARSVVEAPHLFERLFRADSRISRRVNTTDSVHAEPAPATNSPQATGA
jgi:hypothetical protein